MESIADLDIERRASGVRLTPRPERRWLSAASLVAMLGVVAWLAAASEHGVAAFMFADFTLWCWAVASAEWTPILRLHRQLEIRRRLDARAGAPRDVLVDGRPVSGRVHGAAISQAPTRRGPPPLVVFFLAEGTIVRLATTVDRDQAIALARLVREELGITGEPPLYAESPAHSGVSCLVLLAMAILFAAAYLGTAAAIDASPTAMRTGVVVAAAALHGVLAVGLRRAVELACAGATRKAARRIFGVEP